MLGSHQMFKEEGLYGRVEFDHVVFEAKLAGHRDVRQLLKLDQLKRLCRRVEVAVHSIHQQHKDSDLGVMDPYGFSQCSGKRQIVFRNDRDNAVRCASRGRRAHTPSPWTAPNLGASAIRAPTPPRVLPYSPALCSAGEIAQTPRGGPNAGRPAPLQSRGPLLIDPAERLLRNNPSPASRADLLQRSGCQALSGLSSARTTPRALPLRLPCDA